MKNLLILATMLLMFGFVNAQSTSFSYNRQISYNKCGYCDCIKSLSYKTVSKNLTSKQLNCAAVNNELDRRLRDLTKGGTTGGLFGGAQEGCGGDCSHEFQMVREKIESVTLQECN